MNRENTVLGGEEYLLRKWREGDEAALRTLIGRYVKLFFPFALCLSGCYKDNAYDLVAEAGVQSLQTLCGENSPPLMVSWIRRVIDKARWMQPLPAFEMTDHMDLTPEKRVSLKIVKQSLFSLPFESRLLLLLRDQLNLPYDDIADITGISMKEARFQTVKARLQLRAGIEGVLHAKEELL